MKFPLEAGTRSPMRPGLWELQAGQARLSTWESWCGCRLCSCWVAGGQDPLTGCVPAPEGTGSLMSYHLCCPDLCMRLPKAGSSPVMHTAAWTMQTEQGPRTQLSTGALA